MLVQSPHNLRQPGQPASPPHWEGGASPKRTLRESTLRGVSHFHNAHMRLQVKVDTGRFERDLDAFESDVLKASARTANRLIERAQTAGFRVVAREYGIGPRAFEQYARTRLARDGETVASVEVRGSGLPMYHFQPRQTRKGVTVRIKGKRVLVPHAFMARVASGHVGVFARGAYGGKGVRFLTGDGFGRFRFGYSKRRAKDRGQLAINELFTFAAPDAFANEGVVDAMSQAVGDNMDKVMRQELNFLRRGR